MRMQAKVPRHVGPRSDAKAAWCASSNLVSAQHSQQTPTLQSTSSDKFERFDVLMRVCDAERERTALALAAAAAMSAAQQICASSKYKNDHEKARQYWKSVYPGRRLEKSYVCTRCLDLKNRSGVITQRIRQDMHRNCAKRSFAEMVAQES